uniref:Serine/threonine-protein phosphatase n=1 Tax=Cajanus cajan TaxID=3821 RepID=A0A151SUF2_CAJCA|nr:Serine/threonine protein phosphatase 7 [Cajanus cajan]
MDHHKERIKSGCQKILEGINSMSLVNLDDQQVHSLVMMREIARGVVDDRDRMVTKSDVITALRYSIEKMVHTDSFEDIIQILSRISFEGLDDQRMHLVTRMKDIAHGIIDKQPRVAIARPDLLAEQVGFVDEGMRDSPLVESTKISNGDALIDGAQSMTNEDEMLDVDHVLRFENGIDEVQESLLPCFQQFVMWPPDDCITLEWVQDMMIILEQASQKMLSSEFCHVVPTMFVEKLVDGVCSILCKEPNCVDINCQGEDSRVIVVGDIHGQFHDLMLLLKHAGVPSENQIYVFNGNYVDKGAWGVEVLLVLLAWKVLMPHRVYLLRGNHESRYCTTRYGFKEEVWSKYGDQGEDVYSKFLECFKELPLASVIANCAYTTHGGLFRSIDALIIRSHEGPDARAGRDDDFGDMFSGYSIDHDGESGKLYTLFSAPHYPQFGKTIYNNKWAYAVLKSPDFGSPSFHSFKAAERPMLTSVDIHAQASTSAVSVPQRIYPDGMRPEFDFGALGIYNAPCWSVELPDGSGGTQVLPVPRAPLVEGLPLPPNIQEPHKAAYEYLFELVGALKHMMVTRVSYDSYHCFF